MLKIRLQRTGRKHEPTFRVVLTDSKNSTKSGRYLERLGSYDPRKENEVFDSERIKYWISKGAQPSDTLHNLLVSKKIIEGKKRNVLPKKSPIVKDAPEASTETTPAQAEEAPAKEETPEVPAEATPAEEPAKEATPEEAPAGTETPAPAEAPTEEPKAEA